MSTEKDIKKLYYWEDFVKGQTFECGPITISESQIIDFASQYDPQRFHVNKQAAEETQFKGLIASGWQTAAFMMRMVCDSFMVNSSSVGSPSSSNSSNKEGLIELVEAFSKSSSLTALL